MAGGTGVEGRIDPRRDLQTPEITLNGLILTLRRRRARRLLGRGGLFRRSA